MNNCKNCKLFKKDSSTCNQVVGTNTGAFIDNFSNGVLYAIPDIENKNNDCKYYKSTFLNKIFNFFS